MDTRTNLTFTDFSYSIENETVLVTYNLGAFTGNGVEYNGLYMDKKACFTVSLDQAGTEGDAIHVVADNPDANITISLIQTKYIPFMEPIITVRRTSMDGVLSLDGIDPAKAGVDTEYDLIITSDKETTYSLSFEANWTSGSDYFDYSRSGSLGAQGNGSIDKATKLAAGNYGGLVTYAGDPDFYQLNTVYSDTLSVTVNGTGLSVQEYDADGLLVQGAEYADGKYTITVANGNYLRVEGSADLAPDSNQVNSYSLYISDVSSTYLSLGGTEIQLPEKPVVMDEFKDNQVVVTVNVEDGMKGYQSSDLQVWDVCEDDTFVATDNGLYYFKSVDPETKLESKYVSLRVVGIDHVAPTVSNVTADVDTVTNGDVIVTADFADDVALVSSLYRIGEEDEWLDYDMENGVTVTENATVFFKAVDMAGNESEITRYEVRNIDKVAPIIELVGDNTTPLLVSTLTASTEEGLAIFYSTDNATWTKYEGQLEVTTNATYYFKATDAAGNEGTNSFIFANIDTTAPVITLSGDNVTPLQKATLTASTDDGSPIYYRIGDSGEWMEYKEPITVTDNATYNFLSTDAAGNEGTNFLTFANIDTVAPVIELAGDNRTPLQTSTLTATTEAGLEIFYSTDNATWTKYTGEIAVSANTTYFFKATDAAGNIGTAEFTFTNIDTIAPEAPIVSADITDATNQNVTVTAVFSDDSVVKEYSLDGTTWRAYTVPIIFEENGNVSFRSMDAAGNISATTSCTVGNIDKIAPDKPTASADVTAPTNMDVLVSATFSADSIVKEYSLDGENWQAYTAAIKFTDNGSVFFRGTDEAGNVSEVTTFLVNNIDKVAPVAPVVFADITAPTNTDVLVSAQFSDDSVKKEYSFDGQTWKAYTAAIRFTENGTVYFRGADAADNVSAVASYTVSNINKVAPDKPVATIDITAPTNTAVHVSAVFNENSVFNEYSLNGTDWLEYTGSIEFTENGPVYFRSRDNAGNISEVTAYEVTNIDKVAPVDPVASADVTTATNGNVLVSAIFSDDSVVKEYSLDGQIWMTYDEAVVFTENGSVMFRGTDEAGNVSAETKYEVTNIDKTVPVIDLVGDNATPLQASTLTATTEAGLDIYWSTDNETWTRYDIPLSIASNGTYFFKTTDPANNTGTASIVFFNIDTDAPVITLTGDNQTPLQQTTLTATVDDGSPIYYRIGDTGDWTEYIAPITVTDNATYNFLSTDAAGNEGTNFLTFANIIQAPISDVVPQTQTWEKVEEATQYIVEYSTDNFEHVIQLVVDSNSLDSFQMPAGNYQMRVKPEDGEWTVLDPIVASETNTEPKLVKSNMDSNADVFFANPVGTWEAGYLAQHVGSINDWAGTNEYASVYEKNKLADIIEGSNDANILLMTDDDNGDSLFVDDIYTELPGSVSEQQSRIAQIDEIRAGAGNDIVDMTSQQFEYIGDGLTIRGGAGNDTIWANKGDNKLFGDAGNDRIVGASGTDVIAGGIGNDRMHGGGGNDVFTFGENWGTDTVEQLATGSVTLWFASGDESNWNAETLTYTDGDNSVMVSGIAADKITLKFGDDGSDQFATLSSVGAFADFTSQKIFEESGTGLLASM